MDSMTPSMTGEPPQISWGQIKRQPTITFVNQLVAQVLTLGLTFSTLIHKCFAMTCLTTPAAILVQWSIIDQCTCHTFVPVDLGHHFLIRAQIQDRRPYCLRSDECQRTYPPCKKPNGDCLPGSKRWRHESMLLKTHLKMNPELEIVLRRQLQVQGAVQTSIRQLR